jgi:sortase A
MADVNGPVIVRHASTQPYVKPGSHSHNITRRRPSPPSRTLSFVRRLRGLLLILGICGLGYYGYALADQYIYQSYENWAFDQQIAGHSGVTFADYLRQETPFGFLVGAPPKQSTVATKSPTAQPAPEQPVTRPAEGSLLGRVEISRLNLAAIVREGVSNKTLSTAVGHVPSTALPGQVGNFAIAAHRDTLFRALKDIKKDDLVTFKSQEGTYTYEVVATKIVKPSDVTVLRSDGGDIIPSVDFPAQPADKGRLLTMITCYPFYYVGAAPKRFIVEAELVSNNSDSKLESQLAPPPAETSTPPASPTAPDTRTKHAEPHHARGSTRLRHAQNVQTPHPAPSKKRPLWRRILHVS